MNKEPNNQIVPAGEQKSGGLELQPLIHMAIEKKVPVETIERLLAMRTQLKAEFAKEAFDNAMADFQGECPVIKKTKDGGKTKSGIVAYSYAPLDKIVSQTKGLIAKHGFSYQIKTEMTGEKVKAICIVKHRLGHSEQSEMEVPLGAKTDIMSAPQVVASATTFAKRYALCNAFGIITGDEDNEGAIDEGTMKIMEAREKLDEAKNIDELKAVWNSLAKEIKAKKSVIEYTNSLKKKLNENA